jgi:hypothetical protein
MPDQVFLAEALQSVEDFRGHLREQGYAEGTIKHYGYGCRHLVTWLDQHDIALAAVNEDVIEQERGLQDDGNSGAKPHLHQDR